VYRRSLSSDPENQKAEAFKYSEIRKDSAVHVSLSSSLLVKQPGAREPLSLVQGAFSPKSSEEAFRTPHSTTNDNRLLPAVESLISVRSFAGTKTCFGRGPMQRRAQWAVYSPAQSALSTPDVNKSSHRVENFESAVSPDLWGLNAVLEPQSSAVLAYLGTESLDTSGGRRR